MATFSSTDADHDGVVSGAELAAMFDTDHDGSINMKEMEKLAASLTAQVMATYSRAQRFR